MSKSPVKEVPKWPIEYRYYDEELKAWVTRYKKAYAAKD